MSKYPSTIVSTLFTFCPPFPPLRAVLKVIWDDISKGRFTTVNLHRKLLKMEITIRKAQEQVNEWITTTGVRYFNELTNMAILAEEVGELASIMARKFGEQSFKDNDKNKDLGDEMADVLWVILCIANQTGVDLTEALVKNFEKKNSRDAARHKNNEKL